MKIISSALILLFALFTPFTAFAEDDLNWIDGPTTVTLGDGLADLKIGEEYSYLDKENTVAFNKQIGNPITGLEIGSVFPFSEDENWFIVFEYEEAGHIKDNNADDIDADSILKSYMDGNEESNKELKEQGFAPIEIKGWDQKPFYDTETNRLTWSMLISSDGLDSVNYNTRILTRQGYISATLVADPTELESLKPELNQILNGLTLKEGQRYTDFDPVKDKLAGFGLSALIAGGTVAAAKTGLLATALLFLKKFAILIVAALGGIGAWFKRKFKNKE